MHTYIDPVRQPTNQPTYELSYLLSYVQPGGLSRLAGYINFIDENHVGYFVVPLSTYMYIDRGRDLGEESCLLPEVANEPGFHTR